MTEVTQGRWPRNPYYDGPDCWTIDSTVLSLVLQELKEDPEWHRRIGPGLDDIDMVMMALERLGLVPIDAGARLGLADPT